MTVHSATCGCAPKKVIYRGREYFVVRNNYNGTYDIALGKKTADAGESCWFGVEDCVERDELRFL